MIDRGYRNSLVETLDTLEDLDAGKLAQSIINNPPPRSWCMDVYIADGDLYASDYYSTGTTIKYEPDVFMIACFDNRQGDIDPTKTYDIGTSWQLSDKFIKKYHDQYLKEISGTKNINEIYEEDMQSKQLIKKEACI